MSNLDFDLPNFRSNQATETHEFSKCADLYCAICANGEPDRADTPAEPKCSHGIEAGEICDDCFFESAGQDRMASESLEAELSQEPDDAAAVEAETLLTCPFCKDVDFDAAGLKSHLLNDCEPFEKVERLRRL